MIVTDLVLRVELVKLYSELARAIKEAAPAPTADTMEAEALESW